MPLEKRSCSVDGRRLAYRRGGDGAPVLLLHGVTSYSFIWRSMVPALEGRYDVIAPDLLGCGESDKPLEADYSIAGQERLMIGLLDSLSLSRVHLAAHDVGGGIAQLLVAHHEDRFIDLVLMNTVGYDLWPVAPITTLRIPVLRRLAMAALDLGFLRMIVRAGIFHKHRVDDELMQLFWRPLRTSDGRRGFLHLARSLDNRQLLAIRDRLRTLSLPVLIIRGDADPFLSPIIAERLHADIPHSRLERIATAGHFLQEDEPALLAQLTTEFFQAHDAS